MSDEKKVLYAATAYIEDEQGRILTVWNKRYKGNCFPGGKVEDGETPEEGCVRELQEETGLVGEIVGLLFEGAHGGRVDSTRGSWVKVYRVKVLSGEVRPENDTYPMPKWLTRQEFLDTTSFGAFYTKMFEVMDNKQEGITTCQ